jgi:predicted transport protein
VPRAFEVLYEQRVTDCQRAERLLHRKLQQYRSAGNREFFQLPLKAAIKALEGVADEVGRVDTQEQVALEPAPRPAPAADAPLQSGEISVASFPQSRKRVAQKPAGTVVTFEDHAAYTDAPRRTILNELRRRVLSLDDRLLQGEQCTSYQRIAYKIPGGKNFLEVHAQRAAIVLYLADGGCPDPAGIADDIPASHGWGQLKKRIAIVSMEDFEAAMPFIEAAYRAHR